MDDFYSACQERIKKAADPVIAIDELMAISAQDLPEVQVCKFAEQVVTLLSIISQATALSQQDLIVKFRQIRCRLEVTLNYMEQIMEMEKEFPSPRPNDSDCWW